MAYPSSRSETMKMMATWITPLVVLGILSGCDGSNVLQPRASHAARDAETLRTVYRANMQYLGASLSQRDLSVASRDGLLAQSVEFYALQFGRGSETFRAISTAANHATSPRSAARMDVASIPLSAPVRSVVNNVSELVGTSRSYREFRDGLDRLEAAVLSENWSETDKGTALSYLVLLGETMDFAVEHRSALVQMSAQRQSLGGDLVPSDGEMYDGWWKCLAGVTGGAILGGLTGAAAGSVLPALGTTAGGVIGAIGGALAGAGSSC